VQGRQIGLLLGEVLLQVFRHRSGLRALPPKALEGTINRRGVDAMGPSITCELQIRHDGAGFLSGED
jgi:hypothetical protein